MGELIGVVVMLTVLWVIAKFLGLPLPMVKNPLDDPRVEWRVFEGASYSGSTIWNWEVLVDDSRKSGYEFGKWEAISNARANARRLLGGGSSIGKTRPCPLCGKPSQVGKETDTDECARLLTSARAELPKAAL